MVGFVGVREGYFGGFFRGGRGLRGVGLGE